MMASYGQTPTSNGGSKHNPYLYYAFQQSAPHLTQTGATNATLGTPTQSGFSSKPHTQSQEQTASPWSYINLDGTKTSQNNSQQQNAYDGLSWGEWGSAVQHRPTPFQNNSTGNQESSQTDHYQQQPMPTNNERRFSAQSVDLIPQQTSQLPNSNNHQHDHYQQTSSAAAATNGQPSLQDYFAKPEPSQAKGTITDNVSSYFAPIVSPDEPNNAFAFDGNEAAESPQKLEQQPIDSNPPAQSSADVYLAPEAALVLNQVEQIALEERGDQAVETHNCVDIPTTDAGRRESETDHSSVVPDLIAPPKTAPASVAPTTENNDEWAAWGDDEPSPEPENERAPPDITMATTTTAVPPTAIVEKTDVVVSANSERQEETSLAPSQVPIVPVSTHNFAETGQRVEPPLFTGFASIPVDSSQTTIPSELTTQQQQRQMTVDNGYGYGGRRLTKDRTDSNASEGAASVEVQAIANGAAAAQRRLGEPPPMLNERNVMHRYRRIRQQYKDVRERLEKERATTPAKLDWNSPPQQHQQPNLLLVGTRDTISNRSSLQSSGQQSPAVIRANPTLLKPRTNSTPKERQEDGVLQVAMGDISAINATTTVHQQHFGISTQKHNMDLLDGDWIDSSQQQHKSSDAAAGAAISSARALKPSLELEEEGIVETMRRSRRHRVPSRTASEYGAEDERGSETSNRDQHWRRPPMTKADWERHAAVYQQYAANRPPQAYGRYTPGPYPTSYYGGGMPPYNYPQQHFGGFYYPPSQQHNANRPHSAFDRQAYLRHFSYAGHTGGGGGAGGPNEGEAEDASVSDEESEEVGEYNRTMPPLGSVPYPPPSHHPTVDYGATAVMQPPPPPRFREEELYYFGIVGLPREFCNLRVQPRDYHSLEPIERAAFLVYYSLYKRYPVAEEFRKVFKYQHAAHVLRGLSADDALLQIVRSMRDEYARSVVKSKEAYLKTQRQLFSDERETPDSRRESERSGEVSDGDQFSVDSSATTKEPLLYRVPHPVARFSAGGRLLKLNATSNIPVVEVYDLKSLLTEQGASAEVESTETFGGPLIPRQTPVHTVAHFVRNKLTELQKGGGEQPVDDDCLLLWRLLHMLVQQQGRVSGPDLAQLLTEGMDVEQKLRVHASAAPTPNTTHMQHFIQLLFGGHKKEAVDFAVKNGMYSLAAILARRLFPDDAAILDQIEARFLATLPIDNPVITLMNVAGDGNVAILRSGHGGAGSSAADAGGVGWEWRRHAAIVLANLTVNVDGERLQRALTTVYSLGVTLAEQGSDHAADFCFLATHLIAGWDVFSDTKDTEEEATKRRNVLLLSATPTHLKERWCHVDFQATEVYDYAWRLNGSSTGVVSVGFLLAKFRYACRLAELGGFAPEAFRYCQDVATAMWYRLGEFGKKDVLDLCDVARRLQFVANAQLDEPTWMDSLETATLQFQVAHEQPQQPPQQTLTDTENTVDSQQQQAAQQTNTQQVVPEATSSRRESSASHQSSSVFGNSNNQQGMYQQYAQKSAHESVSDTLVDTNVTPMPPVAVSSSEIVTSYQSSLSQPQRQRVPSLSERAAEWHQDTEALQIVSHHQQQQEASVPLQQQAFQEEEPNDYGIGYGTSMLGGGSTTTEDRSESSNATTSAPETMPEHSTPAHTQQNYQQQHEESPPYDGHSQPSHPLFFTPAAPPPMLPQQLTAPAQVASPDSVFESPPTTNNNVGNDQGDFPPQSAPPSIQRPMGQQMDPQTTTERHARSDASPSNNSPANQRASTSWLAGISDKLVGGARKLLPKGPNEMILPADDKKELTWNDTLNRWEGAGVQEETVTVPPPALVDSDQQLDKKGLQAVRRSGGSRYFNAMLGESAGDQTTTSMTAAKQQQQNVANMMPPVPPMFGFMPAPVSNGYADGDDVANPFSVPDPALQQIPLEDNEW